MGIKEKEFVTRYFTYYLYFPKEPEPWIDQIPFIHDLQFELQNTRWAMDAVKKNDLLRKGETSWTDHNGVKHRVVIERTVRNRRWGVNRKP